MLDTRIIAAHGSFGPAPYQKLAIAKADFGNSAEWRASDAFVVGERLSHANVRDTGGWNNANCKIKTDRVGYEAVAQQVVKEAGVAGRQLFAALVAHKVHNPAPIAAIAMLARDSFGVWVVPHRVQFHGQKSHGQNNKRNTTNPFETGPTPERHNDYNLCPYRNHVKNDPARRDLSRDTHLPVAISNLMPDPISVPAAFAGLHIYGVSAAHWERPLVFSPRLRYS
jgi:hypothetical protein